MKNKYIDKAITMEAHISLMKQTALTWRNSTANERVNRLKSLRNWIKTNQSLIREALWEDFRKSGSETDLTEIFPIIVELSHCIRQLHTWMKPQAVSTPPLMMGTQAQIQLEPKGLALIIAPWNYPFNLAIGPLVSALAAGCPAVLKPSEMTPKTAALIEKMISELFSDEEVAVFNGDAQMAESLLNLPFDHIFFTGSPRVGKIVMGHAAKNLASVTLELGGKSPCIVTSSANLKDAAQKIIYGKLVNCGQTCIAPDYLLVEAGVQELLLAELKQAIQKFYDPSFQGIDQSKDLARIINKQHVNRLSEYLNDAIEKGAKIAFGGTTIPDQRYIEPTLLTHVSEDMAIAQEEIFGPILPVFTYRSLEEAIAKVNSKPKPLALYVFDTGEHVDRILQETSSGNALVNDCLLHFVHQELPFGGVNTSGIGKAHGYFGFLAFSNEKGILKQRVGFNNVSLLRPPFGKKTKQLIQFMLKWF